jgi:osmotically-inducible protein OsmY
MNIRLFKGIVASGAMLGMLCGVPAIAQNTAPDNTKVNQGDRSGGSPTADQAKNNKSDREIMRQIRKSIVDDKDLSTYAHNIKIISQHGQVTLKGPVHSDDERQRIEAKAKEVAGAGNVTNQIAVKGDDHGR